MNFFRCNVLFLMKIELETPRTLVKTFLNQVEIKYYFSI